MSQRKSCGTLIFVIQNPKFGRYTSHHAEVIKDHADYGFNVTYNGFDWTTIKKSRDAYIERLRGIYHTNLKNDKVTEIVIRIIKYPIIN